MRIVVAPDTFTGTLTAAQAAEAIATGWLRTSPGDEVVQLPVSDGGPGFVDALHVALGGQLHQVTVSGPLGAPVPAELLVVGETAYVECAAAAGLHLIPTERRDPTATTTYGVGELVAAALEIDAVRRIVIGLGGSGTNDAGAGLLAALGATATGEDGTDASDVLRGGGLGLRQVAALDLQPARDAVAGRELVVATDVDIPLLGLRGATNGFGPQKGATTEQVMALEGSLESFSRAVGRRPDGKDPAVALGAGAAGGLGYALLALGATRVAGISTVLDAVGLPDAVAQADVVITGEGSFDWQSLRGKVITGVAETALDHGRPCVVLAGQVAVGRREYAAIGVTSAYSVAEALGSIEAALERPADGLAALAQRVARSWSHG